MPAQKEANTEFVHWFQKWMERIQVADMRQQPAAESTTRKPLIPAQTSSEEERPKAG